MTLELTIRRRGSLLSLEMERRITDTQFSIIRQILLEPDLTYGEVLQFINARNAGTGNEYIDWLAAHPANDAPLGAGDEVEAYRG
ncbi:MAG TPA: hypothetical protein VFX15_03165 [Actinomycetes bacterium]|nr:hypothetical protein [Actinomycetes bacterium]